VTVTIPLDLVFALIPFVIISILKLLDE